MRSQSFKGLSTTAHAFRRSLWKARRQQSYLFDDFIVSNLGLTKETGNRLRHLCLQGHPHTPPACFCKCRFWKELCSIFLLEAVVEVAVLFVFDPPELIQWEKNMLNYFDICSTVWSPQFHQEKHPIPQTDVDIWPHQTYVLKIFWRYLARQETKQPQSNKPVGKDSLNLCPVEPA